MRSKYLKLLGLLLFLWLSWTVKSVLLERQVSAQVDPQGVCLQLLRTGTLAEAQDLMRQIRSGRPFEELASEHAPEALRERRGFLGKVQMESLHPEVRKALVGLEVGGITGPIRTDEGYLIVRLFPLDAAGPDEERASSATEYFLQGLALDGSKDEEQEIESYRKAIALSPEMKEAHVNLGEALRRKAVRLLLESKRADHGDGKIEDEAILALLDEAIDHLKIALSLDPKMAEAHYNLGLAYAAEGILGLAALEFQEAAADRPDDGEIQKALASVFYLMGDLEEALSHATKAKELKADVAQLISAIEKEKKKRGVSTQPKR